MSVDDETACSKREFMKDAWRLLRDAGFPVPSSGFPYTKHHNFYRAKLRINGKKPNHYQIARLLHLWMKTRTNPEDYVWQCLTGAVKDMITREPALVSRLPGEIRDGMKTVDDGHAFSTWCAQQDLSSIFGLPSP